MSDFSSLSDEDFFSMVMEKDDFKRHHAMLYWEPFPKQKQFFAIGATKKQRMLSAGNQMGKSAAGAFEMACHLTGRYPNWWEGYRYKHPIDAWACAPTTDKVRDGAQDKLCGRPGGVEEFGTGMIPLECFVEHPSAARGGVANLFDTVRVYHETNGIRDGISTLRFKSYEQGAEKFQSTTLHLLWWDEEPPRDVYIEGEARYSAKPDGRSYMTFTPQNGETETVLEFWRAPEDGIRGLVIMGVKDVIEVGLWTEAMTEEAKQKYPAHEHEARLNGHPLLQGGQIFTIPEQNIIIPVGWEPPPHYSLLWGIDFGFGHPFGAVLVAYDRDNDHVYIYRAIRVAGQTPLVHADMMRRICAAAPVAWPHDGAAHEKGSGQQLSSQYKQHDLKMLPMHATFADGSMHTETAVLEMQRRLETGRLWVCEECWEWLEEYRMYHRDEKTGNIVKIKDDLLSATMKAIMMLRKAKPVPMGWAPWKNPQAQQRQTIGAVSHTRRTSINPWTGRADRAGQSPEQTPYIPGYSNTRYT